MQLVGAELRYPVLRTVPIGVGATRRLLRELPRFLGLSHRQSNEAICVSRLPWYSVRWISTYPPASGVHLLPTPPTRLRGADCGPTSWASRWWAWPLTAVNWPREVRAAAATWPRSPDHRRLPGRGEGDGRCRPRAGARTPDGASQVPNGWGSPRRESSPLHVQMCRPAMPPRWAWEGECEIFDSWCIRLMMGRKEHLIACSGMTSNSLKGPASHWAEGTQPFQPAAAFEKKKKSFFFGGGGPPKAAAVAPIATQSRCPRPRWQPSLCPC